MMKTPSAATSGSSRPCGASAFSSKAALRVVFVYSVSIGTALAISKSCRLYAGIVSAWTPTVPPQEAGKKQSVCWAVAAAQRPGPNRVSPASPEVTKTADLT